MVFSNMVLDVLPAGEQKLDQVFAVCDQETFRCSGPGHCEHDAWLASRTWETAARGTVVQIAILKAAMIAMAVLRI